MRTVGDVSRLTGVTVRALHHYDELGLLRPSGRSEAGYHEDEAPERWGDADAFRESARRTASYGERDWIEIRTRGRTGRRRFRVVDARR